MARAGRQTLINQSAIQVVQLWKRCVRCPFRCGESRLTRHDFEPRCFWTRPRREHLPPCIRDWLLQLSDHVQSHPSSSMKSPRIIIPIDGSTIRPAVATDAAPKRSIGQHKWAQ